MMLHDLPKVLARSGVPVHVVAGWETRSHGPMDDVRGVLCHDTVGPKRGDRPSLGVVVNGRPGLDGPLAQVFLARQSGVYVVSAGLCWHAGLGSGHGLPTNDGNAHLIGIEAESTGYGDWTDWQLAAYPRICKALQEGYGTPGRMTFGHYEWTPRKIDPSRWPGNMPGMRRQIAAVDLSEGEDMLDVRNGGTKVSQTVTGEWGDALEVDPSDKAGAKFSVAVGGADGVQVVGGLVNVTADLPAGARLQLRCYTVKREGASWKAVSAWAASEHEDAGVAPTPIQHVVTGKVPPAHRLRVQARAIGLDPRRSATIRALTYHLPTQKG